MKLISKIGVAIALLFITTLNAQIKNQKTETIKVYGNCEMCQAKIEKAGNIKNIAKVNWNPETGLATIIYDANKTNTDQILKRIANVGYDSDKFQALDRVYKKLPGCCHYDRKETLEIKNSSK